MLQNTRGLVLRTIKYGETSVICTIFTEHLGVQFYLIQGIRNNKSKGNKAGILQPSSLLDITVYHKPDHKLQRIKEFGLSHIYSGIHADVIKNCIAIFSSEILLRLLPEHAPVPELFLFSYQYFCKLDATPSEAVANYPIYFIIECSRILGYEIKGHYTVKTPYLNINEGSFTSYIPHFEPCFNEDVSKALSTLLNIKDINEIHGIEMNAATRFLLLEWYIAFLRQHTQHIGNIKSLSVLRAVLH